jgi:hypothetical protein
MPIPDFGQQQPPPEGYSIALFESYIAKMEQQLAEMRAARDTRAVFQLTYLTFSKQVLAAVKARRFGDMPFATDMCCRFVEVYLQQLSLWDARDPRQCVTWQRAFSLMEQGRANVMQAMLLGMNAHINYDLAFVTLGACRAAGDLAGEGVGERALTGNRSGVPTERYSDFLVINQVGWESLALIQDVVLTSFHRPLYLANLAGRRLTRPMGERVLLEARDASWFQTCLLVQARDGAERDLVARLIDSHAASIADVIAGFSLDPRRIAGAIDSWGHRGESIEPEVREGLIEMARRSPAVAELALQQLAFAGADPVAVIDSLVDSGDVWLAGAFGQLAFRHAPRRRVDGLIEHLQGDSEPVLTALEAIAKAGRPPEAVAERLRLDRVFRRWTWLIRESERCAKEPAVMRNAGLHEAIEAYVRGVYEDLERAGQPRPAATQAQTRLSEYGVRSFLLGHPDAWVRLCARQMLGPAVLNARSGGDMSSETIERVLFLKETQSFMEIDPATLVYVAENLEVESYPTGGVIIRAGTKTGGIRLIRSGLVEVTQPRDGRPARIATLGRHDSMGELSALNDTPTTADCTAATPVECFLLPNRLLVRLMHQHPRLAIGLIRMLSERLMATTRQVHVQRRAAA